MSSSANLDPLPEGIRNGMIAMGTFGLVSAVSTSTLMGFIIHRMVCWRKYYYTPFATNQVFVLICNLLLADFHQAISFVISFHWIARNKLVGPSAVCFTQGWLIQIGNVSSGLWVLAIAIHTLINVVAKRTFPHRTFVTAVILVWAFSLAITAIGPIMSQDSFFVPTGAWCWMDERHETERLIYHYLWIFISQSGSLTIYIFIFFYLRSSLAKSSNLQDTVMSWASFNSRVWPDITVTTTATTMRVDQVNEYRNRILKIARYMVAYPVAYIILTLPLAVARISTMANKPPPASFYPIAGSLMASCGVVDVVLYLSTRKALIMSSLDPGDSAGSLSRFPASVSSRARPQTSRKIDSRDGDCFMEESFRSISTRLCASRDGDSFEDFSPLPTK